MRLLIEHGADVDMQREGALLQCLMRCWRPQGYYCAIPHRARCRRHIQTKNGSTAMHNASFKGHEGIVRLLIEQGADVNIENESGFMCLVMRNSVASL